MAVQSVGIANGDGGDDTVALKDALAAITYRFFTGDMAQLENGGLQGADRIQYVVVAAVYAVETQAQTAGVQLALGEVLDAGTVADVSQNLVWEGCLQLTAGSIEAFELKGREVVEIITVAPYEMGEDRTGDDGILMLQTTDDFLNVVSGVDAQKPEFLHRVQLPQRLQRRLRLAELADVCRPLAQRGIERGFQRVVSGQCGYPCREIKLQLTMTARKLLRSSPGRSSPELMIVSA